MNVGKMIPHQIIIEPPKGWQAINWRELWQYKDLFYFLVLRDVKALYRQTILGFLWAIIRPLFSMVIFTIIFGNIAEVDSDGVPYAIFSYVALVPWTYFAAALTDSTNSLVGNSAMLTKVYFPRLVFPLAPVFAKLIDFIIAFVIVGFMMFFFKITPTVYVVFLPVLVVLMILTASGVGMWLAALAVQYRDVKHAMSFVTQLLMYAAPVVWPVSALEERFGVTARWLYGLYPMAGVIEGFRAALLGTTAMPWDLIGIGTLSAFILLLSGAFYFRRTEGVFADVA